jgi:predicted alpha/beta hydrolase family esterase
LVGKLRQRREEVRYPQLPDPDAPLLDKWLAVLATEYERLGDGERVVVCHSLACVLWYQGSAHGLVCPTADRVLLVAPPGPSVLARPVTAAFAPPEWRADVLHAAAHLTRLVASDRDPHCAEGPAAQVYGEPLGLRTHTIRGAGHLTPADGYGPWPELLTWCLEGNPADWVDPLHSARDGFRAERWPRLPSKRGNLLRQSGLGRHHRIDGRMVPRVWVD